MNVARDGSRMAGKAGAGWRRLCQLFGWDRLALAATLVLVGVTGRVETRAADTPTGPTGGSTPVVPATPTIVEVGLVTANAPMSLGEFDGMLVELDAPKPAAANQAKALPSAPAMAIVPAPVKALPAAPVMIAAAARGPAVPPAPVVEQKTMPMTLEPLFLVYDAPKRDSASALVDTLLAQSQPQSARPGDKPTADSLSPTPMPEPPPNPIVGATLVPATDLVRAIHASGGPSTLITMAKNESVAIDMKAKIDRAEVADPRIASVQLDRDDRLIVTGNAFGNTQLRIFSGGKQANFDVVVELNLTTLRNLIKSVSPQSRVTARSVNGTVVLTGTVPDAATSERIGELAALFEGGKVQNQLNVAGVQQTNLRCVVAEVNKRATRALGVNWAIGASDWSRDFFFANNVGNLNPTAFGSNGLGNIVAPNPAGQMTYNVAPTANGLNTNLTFGFPRAEFQMFVNALRENNLFRVLAEPNLTAISGQTASFLAGGEVPIPVTQGGAVAGSITIEYKEFGVRLHFTPTVVGRQLIRLHVLTEFSDAVPGAVVVGGLPAFSFTTRRVESTVECGNGQTFAIAGLLSERVQAISTKLPGMGDLPILGSLFQSVNYQKSNTELVILVTPELVQPLDPQQVGPPPGALMTHPDDFELFMLGALEGPENPPTESEGVPRHEQPVRSRPQMRPTTAGAQVSLRGPWGMSDADGE